MSQQQGEFVQCEVEISVRSSITVILLIASGFYLNCNAGSNRFAGVQKTNWPELVGVTGIYTN